MGSTAALIPFAPLDWIRTALFIALMIVCGVILSRLGKRSESDFFLAGRGLPWGDARNLVSLLQRLVCRLTVRFDADLPPRDTQARPGSAGFALNVAAARCSPLVVRTGERSPSGDPFPHGPA
jgi:hypothetical protein